MPFNRGFSVIDDEREQLTAMCKHFMSIKELCVSCFNGKFKGWQSVTSVRLTSKTSKVTCRRKIIIKGLIGVIIISYLRYSHAKIGNKAHKGIFLRFCQRT